jgi:hypothetical protein
VKEKKKIKNNFSKIYTFNEKRKKVKEKKEIKNNFSEIYTFKK